MLKKITEKLKTANIPRPGEQERLLPVGVVFRLLHFRWMKKKRGRDNSPLLVSSIV